MTNRGRKMRSATAAALLVAAGSWLAVPATAQGIGQVSSCLVETGGSIDLGELDSIGDALTAAKGRGIGAGKYAVATVGSRRIAINSAGVAALVVETPCVGSGPGMKPPE